MEVNNNQDIQKQFSAKAKHDFKLIRAAVDHGDEKAYAELMHIYKKPVYHVVLKMVRNQDDELCLRLSRAGGKLWQSTAIKSTYFPRASVSALFRQYAQYGYWKVRVIQKHKLPASIRHLVPGGFVGALIVLALGSIFLTWARWALVVLLGTYALANLAATILTCARSAATLSFLPVMPFIFMAYHFGYGYGFLRGLIDFVVLRSGGNKKFSRLTRGQSSATP